MSMNNCQVGKHTRKAKALLLHDLFRLLSSISDSSSTISKSFVVFFSSIRNPHRTHVMPLASTIFANHFGDCSCPSFSSVSSGRRRPPPTSFQEAVLPLKTNGRPLVEKIVDRSDPSAATTDAGNNKKKRKGLPWFQEGKHPFYSQDDYSFLPKLPSEAQKQALTAKRLPTRLEDVHADAADKAKGLADEAPLPPPKDPDKITPDSTLPATKGLTGPLKAPVASSSPKDKNYSTEAALAKKLGLNLQTPDGEESADTDGKPTTAFGEEIFGLNEGVDESELESTGVDGARLSPALIKMNNDAIRGKKAQVPIILKQFVPENHSVFGGFCPEGHPSCMKAGALGYDIEQEVQRVDASELPTPNGEMLLGPKDLAGIMPPGIGGGMGMAGKVRDEGVNIGEDEATLKQMGSSVPGGGGGGTEEADAEEME